MIAVVDAGTGNLRSVVRALRAAGELAGRSPPPDVVVTRDPDVVRRADRVLMPGQGSFGDCAAVLGRDGGALARAVLEAVRAGRPFLGICLGLQVLFERSEEAPGARGLGVFPGAVRRLVPREGDDGERPKVPHIGWNHVAATGDVESRERLGPDEWFYFVHSYVAAPEDPALAIARTTHGGDEFPSAVGRDNVLAVQFHPEKSQRAGLSLLARWVGSSAPEPR